MTITIKTPNVSTIINNTRNAMDPKKLLNATNITAVKTRKTALKFVGKGIGFLRNTVSKITTEIKAGM